VNGPLVVLDRQHAGKPGNRGDRGATADLDGDNRVAQWEREALLTPRYLLHAEALLLDAGCDVICLSDGTYAERAARACAYRADVYVAAHLDSGGGVGGHAYYDRRSTAGHRLAQRIAVALEGLCPELRFAQAAPCWDDRADQPSPARPWLWRAWSCIEGVYRGTPVGLCYEPCYLDQPAHAPLLTEEGLTRLGRALAEGVLRHLEMI
jgi:hypothetical protein